MKEIIEKFINSFNEKFHEYLDENLDIKEKDKKIKKLSDWDLSCITDKNKITPEVLKSMEDFIKGFPCFKNVGILLTKRSDPIYLGWHNINAKPCLHLMAFVSNQIFAPFIDIQINVQNDLLRSTYSGVSNEDFDDWIILTNWRKQLNGSIFKQNNEDDVQLMLPAFKLSKREKIRKLSLEKNIDELEPFFEEYFKDKSSYSDVVAFLKENHQ